MAEVSVARGAWLGALCGVAVMIATYAANLVLKKRGEQWTS
jgi:hypothetical protein